MRRDDIDRAKGLAILLVVFGHLVARETPDRSEWSRAYDLARVAVYLFHMPVFFYLSGLVVVLSGAATVPPARLAAFVGGRVRRLLLPFLAFGVLTILGKAALIGLVPIDNPPPSLGGGLLALVWDTQHSPALSVWYLGVLFALATATPVALRWARGRATRLLPAVALLYVTPLPPVLYLDRLHLYALFYVLGLIAGQAPGWTAVLDRLWGFAGVALGLLLVAIVTGVVPDIGVRGMPYDGYLLLAGSLGILAVHGLVRSRLCPAPGGLLELGRGCFAIYLGNTIAIGLAKAVLTRAVPWSGDALPWLLPPMMVVGVALPLLARAVARTRAPIVYRAIA